MHDITATVPAKFAQSSAAISRAIQVAREKSGKGEPTDVRVLTATGKALSPGEFAECILYLSAGAWSWFTLKWIDEYLWPEIKQEIDEDSKEFVAWLKSLLKQ